MAPLTFALQLYAGALAVTVLGTLPDGLVVVLAVVLAVCLAARPLRPATAFVGGGLLAAAAAGALLEERLDAGLAGRDLEADFAVAGFSRAAPGIVRFVAAPDAAAGLPGRVRLSWYDPPAEPAIGECWRLTVRLRRPRGFANPGGFDYEGWLFRQGVGATGYVRQGRPVADCRRPPGLGALRGRIASRVETLLPAGEARAALLALTVGARHRIGDAQWQRYAVTGTSHLMAISGLHVGLAAGFAFVLAWLVQAAAGRRGNLRDRATLAALLVAGGYAVVSGFAVPARRALTMLAIAAVAAMLRRRLAFGRLVGLTLCAVIATDALEVVAPGFVLSFAAVAVLFWQAAAKRNARTPGAPARPAGMLRNLLTMQLSLLFGLMPLTVLLFDRVAWLAPAVNLLVVPMFNVVTVPFALTGMALAGTLAPVGDACLRLAWHSVRAALWLIDRAAALPQAEVGIPELDTIAALVCSLTLLWILLPAGWPGRRLALPAAAATMLHSPLPPPPGCVDLHALDVGHGLAVVARTARRTLVFDAGPTFRSGGNAGTLVVAPFLRHKGIAIIDLLVVSHGDNDHAGGAAALAARLPVTSLLAGEPLEFLAARQAACRAGQRWSWDGVEFRVLYPPPDGTRRGNDASCVIEIGAGDRRALLTGDIEKRGERELLALGLASDYDLAFVPHHGSLTSSHAAFVRRVAPAVAAVSTGHGNRWNLPRAEVVARWREVGAAVESTAEFGALSYRLCEGRNLRRLGPARPDQRRLWHEP